MKKLMVATVASSLCFSTAYAFNFNLGTGTCTGDLTNTNPSSGQTFCADIDDALRTEIESNLPGEGEISLGKYGTGVSNANAFAQRGLGSDYSDVFDVAMVRIGGNIAIDGDIDQIQDDPQTASGFGIGAGLTVGINTSLLPIDKVGPIEMKKLDLFFSVMSYDPKQDFGETSVEGNISSFGLMARYHLIEGVDFVPGNMLSWGGVYLHTGIQRSEFSLKLAQSLQGDSVTVDGPSNTELDAVIGDTSAEIELESTSLTIPVEISTFIRTAWAFTFFGGAGFDIVSGKTTVDFKMNTASITANAQSPASGSYSNTVNADSSGDGEADATNFRAFGGFQINLPFVRLLNVQINKGIGNDLIGANVSAKILF